MIYTLYMFIFDIRHHIVHCMFYIIYHIVYYILYIICIYCVLLTICYIPYYIVGRLHIVLYIFENRYWKLDLTSYIIYIYIHTYIYIYIYIHIDFLASIVYYTLYCRS